MPGLRILVYALPNIRGWTDLRTPAGQQEPKAHQDGTRNSYPLGILSPRHQWVDINGTPPSQACTKRSHKRNQRPVRSLMWGKDSPTARDVEVLEYAVTEIGPDSLEDGEESTYSTKLYKQLAERR